MNPVAGCACAIRRRAEHWEASGWRRAAHEAHDGSHALLMDALPKRRQRVGPVPVGVQRALSGDEFPSVETLLEPGHLDVARIDEGAVGELDHCRVEWKQVGITIEVSISTARLAQPGRNQLIVVDVLVLELAQLRLQSSGPQAVAQRAVGRRRRLRVCARAARNRVVGAEQRGRPAKQRLGDSAQRRHFAGSVRAAFCCAPGRSRCRAWLEPTARARPRNAVCFSVGARFVVRDCGFERTSLLEIRGHPPPSRARGRPRPQGRCLHATAHAKNGASTPQARWEGGIGAAALPNVYSAPLTRPSSGRSSPR